MEAQKVINGLMYDTSVSKLCKEYTSGKSKKRMYETMHGRHFTVDEEGEIEAISEEAAGKILAASKK